MAGPRSWAGATIHSRSVTLSSERVGLTAKMDLIESDRECGDGSVRPVDYKRGKPRETDGLTTLAFRPRADCRAQALVLRDNGYPCQDSIASLAEIYPFLRIT